jgi:hypothetical protein
MRFKTEVIANLPVDAFTLPVPELNVWFDRTNPAWKRGLVVVAGPAHRGSGAVVALALLH